MFLGGKQYGGSQREKAMIPFSPGCHKRGKPKIDPLAQNCQLGVFGA